MEILHMRNITLVAAILLVACAPEIKGKLEAKVEPIEVRHLIVLDTDKLEAYYKSICEETYTTDLEIEKCTNEALGKFIDQFTFTS